MSKITITLDEIDELLDLDNIQEGESLIKLLADIGGTDKLLKSLNTDAEKGISNSEVDYQRQFFSQFENNEKAPQKIKLIVISILKVFFLQTYLIQFALECYKSGFEQTLQIVLMVLFLAVTRVGSIFQKSKNPLPNYTQAVKVYRNGKVQMIQEGQIVVGDILEFSAYDQIAADGVIVKGEASVDESYLTYESQLCKKCVAEESKNNNSSSPFVFAGTQVVEGSGKYVALKISQNTVMGKKVMLAHQQEKDQASGFLIKKKLDRVSQYIHVSGFLIGLMTFIALLGLHIYSVVSISGFVEIISIDSLIQISKYLHIYVLILSFTQPDTNHSILTFTIASCVNDLLKDNVLLRDLNAVFSFVSIDTLIIENDIITENQLQVQEFYIAEQQGRSLNRTLSNLETIHLVAECINLTTNQEGSISDKAIISFFQQEDLYKQRQQSDIVEELPFSSQRKKKSVFIHKNNGFRIYVLGSSEIILSVSKSFVGRNGEIQQMNEQDRKKFEEVIQNYGASGSRTLSIAYRDLENINNQKETYESDLIFIGIFALQNKLVYGAEQAIRNIKQQQINLILIGGENLTSLTQIARLSGFIDESEPVVAMEGKELIEQLDNALNDSIDEGQAQKAAKLIKGLKVVGRATPKVYLKLVETFQELGRTVGVIANGTNIAPALKQADTSATTMISSTEIARDSSQFIILGIQSFVALIYHCRNALLNVRRNLQYNITVIITFVITLVVFTLASHDTPLNYLQMMWLSFIIFTLPQFYLSRKVCYNAVKKGSPFSVLDSLIDGQTTLNIIFSSSSQILCLLFFNFSYSTNFDIPKDVTYTLFFNSFVVTSVFNQINLRLYSKKDSLASAVSDSKYFLLGFVGTITAQIIFVQFGSNHLDIASLSLPQHLICIGLGIICFVIGFVSRYLPKSIQQIILRLLNCNDDSNKKILINKLKQD